jgi:hypothetical protein
MSEASVRVRQAARKAFSVVGRTARMSYAWAREGRRWLSDGSERETVQRVRISRFAGAEKGRGEGTGETIFEGIAPVMLSFRAMTE